MPVSAVRFWKGCGSITLHWVAARELPRQVAVAAADLEDRVAGPQVGLDQRQRVERVLPRRA